MRQKPSHGRPQDAPIVFCDFDGTITRLDVTDEILSRLAAPEWRQIEAAWVEGRIGSRQCLKRQMELVETAKEELDALIDAIPVDPGFPAFVDFARQRAIPLYVVSDGFDYVIRRILRRSGVPGELRNGSHLFASSLRFRRGRLVASFPHFSVPCEHDCATCKPAVIRRLSRGRGPVVFIGDGLSDRFAVRECDLIFAKRQLLAYCGEHGVACRPFETFADVERALRMMVGGRESEAGRASPARAALAGRG
jgi:2-hydroxy-3-keto-5-methylthiopentenyl-1-phosphate phosphatase